MSQENKQDNLLVLAQLKFTFQNTKSKSVLKVIMDNIKENGIQK
jgi:hypothetical protein